MATKDSAKPVNTQKTGKRGGKTRTSWKPGQSGNPKGAPKRGDSWAETIKALSELDGPAIAQMWDTQAKEFGNLPKGITVKQLVIMSAIASLLREPTPGILKELIDRAEGKVKDVVDLTVSEKIIEVDLEDDGQDQGQTQAQDI